MTKLTFLAILALQTALDRRGYSPNAMDGQCGGKTQAAMAAYCTANGLKAPDAIDDSTVEKYFPGEPDILCTAEVTAADVASVVRIPESPSEKAALASMGYESILEMYAERGHVTPVTLKRLNPGLDWSKVRAGTKITMPEVSPVAVGGKAAMLRISLSRFTVSAIGADGRTMALFPCSIARDKAKLPPTGMLKIVTKIPDPNYTYTPDHTPRGAKVSRHIFPPGPNNPVGTVWLGLSIPGYGIHGTPVPERIGRAESHGCFRLSNWNAEKLYELVEPGTPVAIVR